MADEATTNQSPAKEKEETVPLKAPLIKKEDDDDDEEDLFESGDDDVAATNEEEENKQQASSASATNEVQSSALAPAVDAAPNFSPVQSIADIPIPLKSTTRASAPIPTPPSPSSLIDPASFDLPPGVRIPKSVSGSLLRQGKLLDMLKTLPANLINDALVEYDDAVDVKGEAIRNHGAYLYGVVKRYQSVVTRAQNTGNADILPMGDHVTPAVHSRLELLVTTGFCTREEMDEKVRSKIRMLSERDALFALDELSSVERPSIRNFGSYFMGILNRYMRGDQASSKIRPPAARGRDQRSYRDSNPSSHSRERSRDRLDDSNYGRRASNTFNHPGLKNYDDRRNRGQLPAPPPPSNNFGVAMRGDNSRMMQQQVQQQGIYQNHHPSQMQSLHNPSMPGMNMNNHMMPQSANLYGMNQVTNNNSNNMMNEAMQSYGGFMQREGQMQQPNNNIYAQHPYTQQPPPPPPQQQQNVLMNQQPYGNVVQTPLLPNYGTMGGWQQQQPSVQTSQGVAVDIFGLADKAASAVQALANQNGIQQMQQQGLPMSYLSNKSMQNYAVNQQQQAGNSGPYNPGVPQQHAYHSQMGAVDMQQPHHASTDHHPLRSGRRTTATLDQLTPSVQYLVQSIQNSGAVEGPLDDGILGMIHDLPENMAVTALQRFVSIDKTTMRNKTAYLAGILRRELETIKKR